MKDTAFWVPPTRRPARGGLTNGDPLQGPSKRFCTTQAEIKKSYLKGGAGLCGTADDYLKFVQMIATAALTRASATCLRRAVELMLQGPSRQHGRLPRLRQPVPATASVSASPSACKTASAGAQDPRATPCGAASVFGTSFTITQGKACRVIMTQGGTPRLQTRHLFKEPRVRRNDGV